jgi:hypothetical protein
MKVMSSGVAGYGEDGLASAWRRKSIQSVIQWLTQLALWLARSDDQEIIILVGDLGEHVSGFAGIEGARSGLPPYLPQLGHWVAMLGEIAARRNACVHGHQKCVAGSCFSRSMAQRLQAAD